MRHGLQQGADLSVAALALAQSYLQQGKYQELFAQSPAGLDAPQLRARLLTVQGNGHLQLRKLNEAQRTFEHALRLAPNA